MIILRRSLPLKPRPFPTSLRPCKKQKTLELSGSPCSPDDASFELSGSARGPFTFRRVDDNYSAQLIMVIWSSEIVPFPRLFPAEILAMILSAYMAAPFESWWLLNPPFPFWIPFAARAFVATRFPKLMNCHHKQVPTEITIKEGLSGDPGCNSTHDLRHDMKALHLFARHCGGRYLTAVHVDLSKESDVVSTQSLKWLRDIYDSFCSFQPQRPQPGIRMRFLAYTLDLLDTMHHIGLSGAREWHVEILEVPAKTWVHDGITNYPGPLPPDSFKSDSFRFMQHLDLRNFGANLALYMGSLLRQESVHTLHLGGDYFSAAYWDYIFHSLTMPRLSSLSIDGIFSRQHFHQAIAQHPHIRSIDIGSMSMWLEGKFPLRLSEDIIHLAGTEVMIAELAKDTKLRGVRRLLLRPHWMHSCWCMESIGQICDATAASNNLSEVALALDDDTLQDLALHWGPMITLPKSVQHVYIVQESNLFIDDLFLRGINSLARKFPTSIQITVVGSVLASTHTLTGIRVFAWEQWHSQWNNLDTINN